MHVLCVGRGRRIASPSHPPGGRGGSHTPLRMLGPPRGAPWARPACWSWLEDGTYVVLCCVRCLDVEVGRGAWVVGSGRLAVELAVAGVCILVCFWIGLGLDL